MSPSELQKWLSDFSASAGRRPLVMGVLNVTPDSFSDGGQFLAPAAAVDHALQMVADGADLIDVGGESTRPGSLPVPATVQIERTAGVIAAIRSRVDIAISIDTTSAAVAAAARTAGAVMVNDVSAGRDDAELLPLVAASGMSVVLMHRQGTPATMQLAPAYTNVVAEVTKFLSARLAAAVANGIKPQAVLLDPGIGFGKTVQHNLKLLAQLPTLVALGRPVLVGTSRKGFLGKVLENTDESARLLGTAATVAWAIAAGAAVLRVHDVRAMSHVVRMTQAIRAER